MKTTINNIDILIHKNRDVYQLYIDNSVIPTLDMEWDGEKWVYVQKDATPRLKDIEQNISDYIEDMAKREKNEATTKPDKGIWADVIKASVKGNPKPKPKKKKEKE